MLDTTQIIQEQFLHLKILNKTTSAHFPLSCNVIYLQVLRIMMWMSLGDSLYSAYFIMVEWITIPTLHSHPQNRTIHPYPLQ